MVAMEILRPGIRTGNFAKARTYLRNRIVSQLLYFEDFDLLARVESPLRSLRLPVYNQMKLFRFQSFTC